MPTPKHTQLAGDRKSNGASRRRPFRLLLINPAHEVTFWGLEYAMDLHGSRYSNAPLAILTVAALTPDDWEVSVVDENVSPIDFDFTCDVVGISAMNVQAARAFAIADAFRRRGRTVVMGGPFATLEPDRCRPHADVLVTGDAEHTWPRFCREFSHGKHTTVYNEPEKVDLSVSPIPRYDLVRPGDYGAMPVQTSRGCPFTCEFCDIIVMHGRRVRTKRVEQVVAEVRAIQRAGGDSVFFTDDNFVGNLKYARELASALETFQKTLSQPIPLFTQVTVNLADKPDLLEKMVRAGFTRVFLGIETPRRASLAEAGKRQNLHGTLLERIHRLQHAGLMIWAGMIVGFDHDDMDIFEEHASFLDEAGIPVAMIGMLNAPPKTPLYRRLLADGRIDPSADWTDNCAWTNIIPKQLSRSELLGGYRELLQTVYARDNYARRVFTNIHAMKKAEPARLQDALPGWGSWRSLGRATKSFSLSRDPEKRSYFLPNFLKLARSRPDRIVEGATHLGMWKHYATYVPELVQKLNEGEAAERIKERERSYKKPPVSLPIVTG